MEPTVCKRAELISPCSPQAASAGRRFVTDTLLGWGVADGDPVWRVLADVSLVASELLGNAARFGTGQIELRIDAHRDYIRLAVTDDHPSPARLQRAGTYGLSGRGLAIVAALSDSWGQTPYDGHTKTVWADVAFAGESVLARGCVV